MTIPNLSWQEIDDLVSNGKIICQKCGVKGTNLNRINFLAQEILCDNCYMLDERYDLRPG